MKPLTIKAVDCAHCGALPGEPCTRTRTHGWQSAFTPIKSYHRARRLLWKRVKAQGHYNLYAEAK